MATLPPHKYRELVNELRDVAIAYKGTQQLRAQLERTLSQYVQPEHVDKMRIPRTELEKYKYGECKDYPIPKRERG
ncbi:hypothetical protein [Enterobacter bugandensis]|uniref:hypothetical protein n=1 Tax=Enterobacter bugandensis TaxID=881260 RepID=UPI0020061352|nr:hypothetical protein [Enterobacter bugandensis]MCK7435927.1 hypothetical protein [Enterobacter bugandensis]